LIINSDAVKWAREYTGDKFHALLCDPPYHLISGNISFDWSNLGGSKSVTNKDGRGHKKKSGFMGKQWDGGDVAFDPATWEAFKGVLHDGAFCMAFASSRGWHRLAVAIEDAGFIIHPSIFGWAYGSGFPKATRIDTQVDKAAGAEREIVGKQTWTNGGGSTYEMRMGEKVEVVQDITAPATPLAEAWAGHRYGLQALKPALEPIIVFQKPYKGKPVENITRTGAGALNIDGGRIGTGAKKWETPRGGIWATDSEASAKLIDNPAGRWPANFILTDAEAARRLDEQSGTLTSGKLLTHHKRGGNGLNGTKTFSIRDRTGEACSFGGDSGGSSRFFYNVAQQLDEADAVKYQAKASRKERDAGLDGMDKKKDAHNLSSNACARCGKRVKRNGSGNGCECGDLRETIKLETTTRNPHPTVKPLDLSRYLATLLLPPDLYAPRRIFIPFAGVGSEMIGAILAGWEDVTGVELTDEYIPIAEARIKHWSKRQLEF